MDNAELKQGFLREAEQRLDKLRKSGMAFNTGYSSLNTAVWNLSWDYPDVGPKAAAIKRDIEENFHPYMKQKVREHDESGKLHQPNLPIKGGLYRYEAPDLVDDKVSGEPLATLVMRFRYRRHIKPKFNVNALRIADDAIGQVSRSIGFDVDGFITDLEKNNISLNPYYHASSLSEEKGGAIRKDDLIKFIKSENKRYESTPADPHMLGIDSRRFYQDHKNKYIEHGDLQLNRQRQTGGMKFGNNEVSELNYDSYTMRAIANKVRQGYAMNTRTLHAEISKQLAINSHVSKMSPDEYREAEFEANQQLRRIIEEFDKGLRLVEMPMSPEKKMVMKQMMTAMQSASGQEKSKLMTKISRMATPPGRRDSLLHWGVQTSNGRVMYRVGLEITGGAKRNIMTTLNTTDLKLLLSNLTLDAFDYFKSMPAYKFSDAKLPQFSQNYISWAENEKNRYNVGRNEFYVPNFSMYFSSNGLDSDPGTSQHMPVIPMLRKLPVWNKGQGQVLYDRDTVNLGRNHLIKNWNQITVDTSTGRPKRVQQPALAAVVEKWGTPSIEALRNLSGLRGIAPFSGNEEDPSVADVAWKTVMQNRTGAETVYENLIKKYGDNYQALDKDILDRSLATALETYYEYNPQLEDSELNRPLFRMFANGLPGGEDVDAWKRMAQQVKTICRGLPGKNPCKTLASQYPRNKDEFQFLTEMFDVVKNNLPSNPLLGAIQEYKRTGDWDRISKYIDNHLDSVMATDQDTKIDAHGWNMFSQYGYSIAKMMDFVSCLMHASCGEKIPGAARGLDAPKEDEIFGRHYSTSSGKGDGGQIMIGLHYAFNAEEVSADPDDTRLTDEQRSEAKIVRAMVNKERNRRHDAFRIRKDNNTYRKSSYWERMEDRTAIYKGEEVVLGEHTPLPYGATPEELQEEALRKAYDMNRTGTKVRTIKVIETLDYFIGEAGSAEGMLKRLVKSNNWESILSELERRFPTLQKQLNMLIMPVNARLDLLELSAKRAIDNVRKKLEQEPPAELAGKPSALRTEFEIILEQDNGTSVLSTDQLDSDASSLENFIDDIKSDNGNEDMVMPGEPGDIRAPEAGMGDNTEAPELGMGDNTEAPDNGLPATERVEDSTGIPITEMPPTDVMSPQPQPVTPTPGAEGAPPLPQMPQDSVPTNVPPPPVEEKKVPKSMPGNNTTFVGKDKAKRHLFRDPSQKGSSVVDRLEKVADELDKRGIPMLADKIDLLLWKLKDATQDS